MWWVLQFSPHAWVPLKAPSRGPESEKLLVETSGNFALRKVFGWMPFPNNMSFAVFSHSKGLGAKWHVCCWGILSDSCLETNFCKKSVWPLVSSRLAIWCFFTERVIMQLPTNWLFPKSFDSAGSSPMVRPMFWPFAVQDRTFGRKWLPHLMCSWCEIHSYAQWQAPLRVVAMILPGQKNWLIHHPAWSSWTSFASSSWSSSLWSSSSPSSSSSSTEDPWVMDIYHSTVSPGTTACYLLHSSSIKQWSHGWGWSSLRAPETKSRHNFAF